MHLDGRTRLARVARGLAGAGALVTCAMWGLEGTARASEPPREPASLSTGSTGRDQRDMSSRSPGPTRGAPDPLPEVRGSLRQLAAASSLEEDAEDLEQIAADQPFLMGRAGYELLVLEAATPVDSRAPVGLRELLGELRRYLGQSPAGKVLAGALAIRREPRAGGLGLAPMDARSLADQEIASAILGAGRQGAPERLAKARGIVGRLGDPEGEGVLLVSTATAEAASGTSAEQACQLFDAAAEAFDRAGDAWSAASARESCALLGEADGGHQVIGDIERLRAAAEGFRLSGDRLSELRGRLALGGRLLGAFRGLEALEEFRAVEGISSRAPGAEEPRRVCLQGIADAAILVAEQGLEQGSTTGLEEILEAGASAARDAGSVYHQAWIAYESARLRAADGKIGEARSRAHAALASFRVLADDEGIAESAYLLAGWESAAGKHAEAASLYREAGMASAALGELDAERSLGIRGAEELRRAGQFEAAGRLARTLLEEGHLTPRRRQEAMVVLGDAVLLAGNPEEAAVLYRQAIALSDAPALAVRGAAALLRSGRSREAAAMLEPLVMTPDAGRLEERYYLDALRACGLHPEPLPALQPGENAEETWRGAGRRAGRLLAAGKGAEALAAATDLAASGGPRDLFDAAAIAAGAGHTELGIEWGRRALERGLDPILVELDPELRLVMPLPEIRSELVAGPERRPRPSLIRVGR